MHTHQTRRLLPALGVFALITICTSAPAQVPASLQNTQKAQAPLTSAAGTRPDHLVLGYVPYWRDSIANPQDLNFSAFTHLARAFLRPQPDGSLLVAPDYFNLAFEDAARARGVKLLMSIGGQARTPDVWLAMARNPEHVQTFLNTLASLYEAHHYDGVDIDWEPPPQNDADGQVYASLLHAIRARFPSSLLTIAVEGSNYGVGHLPMADIAQTVDYVNAMTYDFSGPWTGVATFGSNLHADASGPARTRASVDAELHNLIDVHGLPPAKVVVGLRFWANRFRADQLGAKFPAHQKGYADDIEFQRVLDLLGTGRYTQYRDQTADAPYLVRNDGGCVITYDDPESIRDKCATVLAMHCAGVMIWHVNADLGAGETPLLSAVAESFGMPPLPISPSAIDNEITQLSHHPIPSTPTIDALQRMDAQLRSLRGQRDDENWMNAAPASAQSAATMPSTQPRQGN